MAIADARHDVFDTDVPVVAEVDRLVEPDEVRIGDSLQRPDVGFVETNSRDPVVEIDERRGNKASLVVAVMRFDDDVGHRVGRRIDDDVGEVAEWAIGRVHRLVERDLHVSIVRFESPRHTTYRRPADDTITSS